jgi:hypothetical protein
MYFFSGNRDLVGFLFGFLADEPHHLLDLLGDICVVHFHREGIGIETEKIDREREGNCFGGRDTKEAFVDRGLWMRSI